MKRFLQVNPGVPRGVSTNHRKVNSPVRDGIPVLAGQKIHSAK